MTTETRQPRRVALLARPGPASERLRQALQDAGAECVLEADPTELDSSVLSGANPQTVMIALDAITEDALERFDAILGDPAIDVLFEEADLVVAREGWDAARWQRHLEAKLYGHRDVLPPGPGNEPDASISLVGESEVADFQTSTSLPDPVAFDLEAEADLVAAEQSPFDPVAAEAGELSFDFATEESVPMVDTGDDLSEVSFDAIELNVADDSSSDDFADFKTGDPDTTEFEVDETLGSYTLDTEAGPSGDATGNEDQVGSDQSAVDNAPEGTVFGELTLDDGTGPALSLDSQRDTDRFRHDLSEIESRITNLELVDDTPVHGPEQASGAVLVMAGLGGPDAVRQFLGALPVDFPRPVLVQQRLDGGRYDKLVAQMQRATKLTVKLAESGKPAMSGVVYVLPEDVGVETRTDGLRFNDTGNDVLAALPPSDTAVLMLSGSDPERVDAVMKQSWAGATVAGQAVDGCYDAAASNALSQRGADTDSPANLAQRMAERWPVDHDQS